MSGYERNWDDGAGTSTGDASLDEITGEGPSLEGYPDATVDQVAKVALESIRKEAVKIEIPGDKDDRRFRRAIDETVYDLEHGMTAHSAGRAVGELDREIEVWFERRRSRVRERDQELSGVIASMGTALKALKGDDNSFHGGLDQHLDRLRKAADNVQMRSVSARLTRILDATASQVATQREASEARIRSLSEMVRGLHQQLDETKAQMEIDALTGLYNRGSFDARLAEELQTARLSPYTFSLIMIDLDHFKAVNDTHGHIGGDRVLQACAKALQAVVMSETDFCARYGGEEMAIILSDTDAENAARIAEAVRARLEQTDINTGAAVHRQTASFGVAEGCDEDTADDLINRADSCLYLAKQNGRNRVVVAGQGEGKRIQLPESLLG